ncbi:MAG: toxin-antitoxin system protein [Chloroflexota bacterium]|nr:toxin-antitoxin system protein [Chloroflexota bacterium]
MAMTTVKISTETRDKLAKLAAARKRPMSEVLAEIVERERRRAFLEGLNQDFARLRADPAAWADYQAEIRSMEGTLMDGLEDDTWVE